MRHALTAVAVLALVAGCASLGPPPGGPTESAYPRVISTLPDTNAVNVRPNKVLIRYDDVIGEQANGGDLSKSVLISPWDGEPKVEWKRTGMTIHPRGNWRTNTAYTITIVPGIGDLRNRPSPFGYVMRFSTGPTIPNTAIRGVTFDWVQGRPLPKTTVLAIDVRDSTLAYLTVSDSTGRFELGAVPPGTYVMRAIDEKTPNRQLDPREPWDTATVTLRDSARADLYVFVHDTLPVRIAELRQADSVSITMVLDKPLKPGVPIPLDGVRVVASDSTVLDVIAVRTEEEDRLEREKADSLSRLKDTTSRARDTLPTQRRTIDPTRRRDTTVAVPPPVATRKPPATQLVVKLRTPLKPGSTYRITTFGLQNILGVRGTATRLLIIPKLIPPDSTKGKAPSRPGVPGAPGSTPPRTPPPADSSAAKPVVKPDSSAVKPAVKPAKPD